VETDPEEFDANKRDSIGRRYDVVLHMQQNNAEKTVTISNANEAAAALLGYTRKELIGLKLQMVLAERLAASLDEDLEFADDALDLGDLLSRQRDIRLRHRLGSEIPAACTISRLMSEGTKATFQLLIPNDREKLANQKMRDFIALNLEGRQQLDPDTGLPNRETVAEFLPLIQNFLVIPTGFAVIRLDRYEKNLTLYGREQFLQIFKHTLNCCRTGLRTEDMVFGLSDHTLGVLMFNITRESARVMLNRLRWTIRSHRIEFGGKSDFAVTVSISFDMLHRERSEGLLDRCETAIRNLAAEERNALIELGN